MFAHVSPSIWRPFSSISSGSKKVFVSNLPWDVDNEELYYFMVSQVGPVKDARIYFKNGQSTGCGTVEFEHPRDAKIALARLEGNDLGGRPLNLCEDRRTTPRTNENRQGSNNMTSYVLVENIKRGTRSTQLKKLFGPFVPKFAEFLNAGSAIVSLLGSQQASQAVKALDGTELDGSKLAIREVSTDSMGKPVLPTTHVKQKPRPKLKNGPKASTTNNRQRRKPIPTKKQQTKSTQRSNNTESKVV